MVCHPGSQEAYWHVLIARRFRKFLAIHPGDQVCRFTVLPFGLNIAPRVFTKLMRCVAREVARSGVQVLMYLDDWLIQAPSPAECSRHLLLTQQVSVNRGLLFNLQKSCLILSQVITWLGMTRNSRLATLTLSPDIRLRCLRKVRRTLVARNSPVASGRALLALSTTQLKQFPSAESDTYVSL